MSKPSPSRPHALLSPVTRITRSDRWLACRRLQELNIPCWCPADGSLWVEIDNGIQAILLRSAIWQLTASRQDCLDWLDRCWTTNVPLTQQ